MKNRIVPRLFGEVEEEVAAGPGQDGEGECQQVDERPPKVVGTSFDGVVRLMRHEGKLTSGRRLGNEGVCRFSRYFLNHEGYKVHEGRIDETAKLAK